MKLDFVNTAVQRPDVLIAEDLGKAFGPACCSSTPTDPAPWRAHALEWRTARKTTCCVWDREETPTAGLCRLARGQAGLLCQEQESLDGT